MDILFLTQFCTPEPFPRSVPLARELLSRGHQVRIVTGFPNYPGGHIYSGYRQRLWQRETLEGVPITRVPLYPSHDASGFRRLLCYGSFFASCLPPLLLTEKPDLIYAYAPPTKGLAAVLAGAVRSVPFVYDVQDLWPDALLNSGMARRWMLGPVRAVCNLIYRRAARILTLSPGFKRALEARGVSGEKIETIYNWCDEDQLMGPTARPLPSREPAFAGRFNILFAGGMGKAQGLHAVIEAAALVEPLNPRIQFVFMGSGRLLEELKTQAAAHAPRTTLFLPRRPMREAAGVLQAADVLLVHLRKHPLYEITIPSKTQAYLAMGKPILMGVAGDAASLVCRAGAGLRCEPEAPQSIAQAALRLAELPSETLQDLGRSGRDFYQANLSLRVGAAWMETLFLEAIRAPHIAINPQPSVG